MSPEERFGRRLRLLRKLKGLTQEALAEKAGLEYKYIQMLEGKKPPSPTLRTLTKIAGAFNMTVVRLVDFHASRAARTTSKRLKAAED